MGNISFKEYSIFCIGKIWVDWPGMDLSIYPRSRFGPSEPGFCFGLIWSDLGIAWSPPFLWFSEWDIGPIYLSPSYTINLNIASFSKVFSEFNFIFILNILLI